MGYVYRRSDNKFVGTGSELRFPEPTYFVHSRPKHGQAAIDAALAIPESDRKVVGDTIAEMTQAEKDARDASDLTSLKANLRRQISLKADSKIETGPGFEWPASSGVYFKLDAPTQRKWIGLNGGRDLMSWPYTIRSSDGIAKYSIQNSQEARDMYGAAMTAVLTEYAISDAAKDNVDAATDAAGAIAAANAYLQS